MRLIHPLIYHCPEDLQGDNKFIMNIMVNGSAGNLGPFTITQLMIYSDFDRKRVDDAIKNLAARNIVKIYSVNSLAVVNE
jgi:hypothetical protein